ncbi:unnamed protein product, partial [Tetraodon nigroviridis]
YWLSYPAPTTALTCVLRCFPCEPTWAGSPFLHRPPTPPMVRMTRSKTFQAYLPSCHRTYSCIHCRAHLANHDELISKCQWQKAGRHQRLAGSRSECGLAEAAVRRPGTSVKRENHRKPASTRGSRFKAARAEPICSTPCESFKTHSFSYMKIIWVSYPVLKKPEWSRPVARTSVVSSCVWLCLRVNVGCGPAEERVLLTGLHAVADIYCENCKTTLGWKYEHAFESSQKYKEGKFIIELAHMIKDNGWD